MGSIPTTGEPAVLASPENKNSAASYLYMAGVVVLLLAFSYLGQDRVGKVQHTGSHIWLYCFQVIWEFILLGVVWVGARLAGMKFRDLIGGRWATFESFLLDVIIAKAFQ